MEKAIMKAFCFGLILLLLVSCANPQAVTNIIGVYKPVDKTCNGSSSQINTCNKIQLIEFVYGNFYQVSKNQIAFVVWSGEPAEDFLYVVNKIKTKPNLKKFPKLITLAQEDSYVESLQFNSPDDIIYTYGDPKAKLSTINLRRISSTEISSYKKEYPGSD